VGGFQQGLIVLYGRFLIELLAAVGTALHKQISYSILLEPLDEAVIVEEMAAVGEFHRVFDVHWAEADDAFVISILLHQTFVMVAVQIVGGMFLGEEEIFAQNSWEVKFYLLGGQMILGVSFYVAGLSWS
jgi:hypothetical protein